jgi:SAM-dependent methyltransferase
MFGEVASFDVSPEAVRQAQAMFRHLPSLTFFEADGTHPDRIAQLGDGTFDLVLLREFLPLARDIAGSPRPLDIVGGYYRRLRAGGVLIIEHALPPGAWGRNEGILQTAKLVRAFRGQVFHTLALDVAQGFSPGFRGRSGRMLQVCATMLSPLVVAYCLLRRINLSKTVIIRKPDVP